MGRADSHKKKKETGKIRLCGDFQYLNTQIISEKYPLPTIDYLLARLVPEAKFFAKIDFKDAFFLMEVEEKSRDLLTIISIDGAYRYKRCPFGVKIAPSAFQNYIDSLLKEVPGTALYLDDFLVSARTEEELKNKVALINKISKENSLTINYEKSVFNSTEVEWLGFMVSEKGLRPNVEKLEILKNLKSPKNKDELKSFLGTINYWRKFRPNHSKLA